MICTLPRCLLSARCHCTILFSLRAHNRLVQYSETELCQPQHILIHFDTDYIALPYSPEWDQETRCRMMDRYNHRLFSCQYTSVKHLSIFQIHQYTVRQETWYRFSGSWLKNSFIGKLCYLLVSKCQCSECISPKFLIEPYYFKIMYTDNHISFSGLQYIELHWTISYKSAYVLKTPIYN